MFFFCCTEVLLKESNFKIFYKNYLAAALSESYLWLTDSWIDLSKKKIHILWICFYLTPFSGRKWRFNIYFPNSRIEHLSFFHNISESGTHRSMTSGRKEKKSIQNLGFETVQFVLINCITKKSPHYLDNGYVFSPFQPPPCMLCLIFLIN